eukprot:TRINITY_DN2346_c0_g1_i2.p1 TRINITY_DN2346_c0_g1~~TRINITY_DN2346_c0_g1_i2.p1  ORF type:complete len:275 (+),score=46.12 TRINITY_DN2346_c0_g1_i2:123-827(+)
MNAQLLLFFLTAGFSSVLSQIDEPATQGGEMVAAVATAEAGTSQCRLNDCTLLGYNEEDLPVAKGVYRLSWFVHDYHPCYGYYCHSKKPSLPRPRPRPRPSKKPRQNRRKRCKDDDDDDDDKRRRLLDDDDCDDDDRRRLLQDTEQEEEAKYEYEDQAEEHQDNQSKCEAAPEIVFDVAPCCEEYIVQSEDGEDVCDIVAKFGYEDCDTFSSDLMKFNNIQQRLLKLGQTIQIC